jgi:hypothetical protein
MSIPAVTAAENTISRRVSAVTGIARPVTIPFAVSLIPTIPVNVGARATAGPTAVKASLGVGEL